MSWVLFSILTALFESLKDLAAKLNLRHTNRYVVTWAAALYSLPATFILALFEPFPEISSALVAALLGATALHIAALLFYMQALSLSPMSLTLPIISFTPAFMLLTSPIMINEVPSKTGVFGVLTIVAGTFLLSGGSRSRGWAAPVMALIGEKGVQLMLLVAFLWSLSGNLDRVGLNNSGPFWWLFFLMVSMSIGLSCILVLNRKSLDLSLESLCSKPIMLIGFLNALSMICYIIAIGDGFIAYVVSIKRLSIFLGICWGYLYLREQNVRERLLGSAIMFIGLLIVSFS